MRQFLEYYQSFDVIDVDDDRRISWSEFVLAVPLLEKWVGKIKDKDQTFFEMDKDNKGKVLFDEFLFLSKVIFFINDRFHFNTLTFILLVYFIE